MNKLKLSVYFIFSISEDPNQLLVLGKNMKQIQMAVHTGML